MTLCGAYDPTIFDIIPSLEDAHASVESNGHFDGYLKKFATLAAKLALNDTFGLALVHRHTRMDPGTRMLDFKQTLQPFPLADAAKDLHGCPIRPKSWARVDGIWKPFEYELGEAGPVSENEIRLFTEVEQNLEELGMTNIGLRRYSPDDVEELEVTESAGISVKIPMNLIHEQDFVTLGHKTTFWAYPTGADGEPRLYRCACRDTGSSTNPNHNHIDG